MRMADSRTGFTLIEIAFSILVIGILAVVILPSLPKTLLRAQDGRRKDALAKYKTAFEDYYSDHSCYPPEGTLDSCGGTELQPYIPKILCDEKNVPFVYIPSADCKSYEIYTHLQADDDPDIERVGCSAGCGPGQAYNYGVSNEKLQ